MITPTERWLLDGNVWFSAKSKELRAKRQESEVRSQKSAARSNGRVSGLEFRDLG